LALRSRELAWEGCLNVRDLGGLPTQDGAETRYGRVVRADSVRQLSEAGWKAVADYGVRTVVDLRGDYELRDDPPAELPLDVVHVPFMEANQEEWNAIVNEIESPRFGWPSLFLSVTRMSASLEMLLPPAGPLSPPLGAPVSPPCDDPPPVLANRPAVADGPMTVVSPSEH